MLLWQLIYLDESSGKRTILLSLGQAETEKLRQEVERHTDLLLGFSRLSPHGHVIS